MPPRRRAIIQHSQAIARTGHQLRYIRPNPPISHSPARLHHLGHRVMEHSLVGLIVFEHCLKRSESVQNLIESQDINSVESMSISHKGIFLVLI